MRTDEKYKDELFPPILSSIFRGGVIKNSELKGENIRWMRLADLFRDRRTCVISKTRSNIEIYCELWKECGNFIGDAFTAIKDCKGLLRQMFEQE